MNFFRDYAELQPEHKLEKILPACTAPVNNKPLFDYSNCAARHRIALYGACAHVLLDYLANGSRSNKDIMINIRDKEDLSDSESEEELNLLDPDDGH